MPTYVYKCLDKECEHEFEVFQSIKDDPIEKCENCGSKVRKVFGATAIIFKGSGFYVNDYKKQDKSNNSGKSNNTENNSPVNSTDAGAAKNSSEKNGKDKIKAS